MNLNNFTIKAQEAVQFAQEEAINRKHASIEAAHLFTGLQKADEHILPFLLRKAGVDDSLLAREVEKILNHLPTISGGEVYLSPEANRVLQRSIHLMKEYSDEFVTLEVLLQAILDSSGSVSSVMKSNGLTEKLLKSAIQELRKGTRVESPHQEESYNAL